VHCKWNPLWLASGAAMCSAGLTLGAAPAGNGNAVVFPHFSHGPPHNVVGLRYNARVERNDSTSPKIIFTARRLWNPQNPSPTYLLESNLYSYRYAFTDDQCTNFPPVGTLMPAKSALWVSVPDYNMLGKIGAKTHAPSMFPRQTIQIDGIAGLQKVETISQIDITGKDISIEYSRGDLIAENTGWKTCGALLDGDSYRRWTSRVMFDGDSYQIDFALPDAHASYLHPNELMSITSEFLAELGPFKAYFWGVEFLRDGSLAWEKIGQWRLMSHEGPVTNVGWGVKRSKHQRRTVMEFSNLPPPDHYITRLNQVFTLFETPPDFDRDGKADFAVYRPSSSSWFSLASNAAYSTWNTFQWGVPGDVPVRGDYDGDGTSEVAVYRPSTGAWYILNSLASFQTFGAFYCGTSTDIPVPADFDGDGRTDIGVYRPSTGQWFVTHSSSGNLEFTILQWGGLAGDQPLTMDIDGDGRADPTIYRPSTGGWFSLTSATSESVGHSWGLADDVPIPGDYDGDGRADLAVYRPSTGHWFIRRSSTGFATFSAHQWGIAGDVPVAADYDGDGTLDLAVYRASSGTWFVLPSATGFTSPFALQWGISGDVPLARPGQ
jgi:FG-GAP-like repeat